MNTKRHQRGAALIVALAILVVLLALAITFLTTSRLELQVATNVEEQLRTELLANGGLAIAIAFLQHDLLMHPTYTSLDHAWKTYFSGAWAAGKPWMFPDGRRLWNILGPDVTGDGNPDPIGPGVPVVSLTALAGDFPTAADGRPIFDTENSNDWLYLPIANTNPTVLFPPIERNYSGVMQFDRSTNNFFVISDQVAEDPSILGPSIPNFVDPITNVERPRLPAELADIWADVDNTGDGVKDAMWLPVPRDIDFSDDGIDNDLNGVIDNTGEIARFMYWDTQRERIMLTAPMVVNGLPVLNIPDVRAAGAVDVERLRERYNIPVERMQELMAEADRWAVLSAYGHQSVDRRDNDHDFLEGNARTVDLRNELNPADPSFLGQNLLQGGNPFDFAALRDLFPIHPRYSGPPGSSPFVDQAGNDLPFIYSSGEPVTEIVGRLAITITDTASRVDLGAIGGFARDVTLAPGPYARVRSIGEGVSTFEYEPRVIPAFAAARTEKLWNLAVGAPNGLTNERLSADRVANGLSPLPDIYSPQYEFDVRHPGYGMVDDNANAFALAMDGVDNDGTGLVDPVFSLGSPADHASVRLRYLNSFGFPFSLEGIDEPSEYQRYRPHRNRIAESDGVDNNPPLNFLFDNGTILAWEVDDTRTSITDEVGELGDIVLRSKEQIKQIVSNERFVSGQRLYDVVRNLSTVHATQRTERRRFTNAFGQTIGPDQRPVPERGDITGTKLDLNYASVEQIFNALTEDFGYPSLYEEFLASLNQPGAPRRQDFPAGPGGDRDFRRFQLRHMQDSVGVPLFALGLGIESLDLIGTRLDRPIELMQFDTIISGWTADERLRAAQLAVNIADFRDRDHNRTSFTFTVPDLWWELAQIERNVPVVETREIEYTVTGIESIRINEIMPRPVRRVEAEMLYGVADPDPQFAAALNVNYPVKPANTYFPTSPWYLRPSDPDPDGPFAVPGGYTQRGGALDPQLLPSGTPDRSVLIFRNFDPNYFSIFTNGAPDVPDVPDFRMSQRFFAWWNFNEPPGIYVPGDPSEPPFYALNSPAAVYNPVQTDLVDPDTGEFINEFGIAYSARADGGWERIWNKQRVIGSETALYTRNHEITRQVSVAPPQTLTGPNFAEFEFLPSPGLPPGRYYLKLNTSMLVRGVEPTTGGDPQGEFVETVTSPDQLRFAIKYDLPGRGFIADIAEEGQFFIDNYLEDEGQSPVTWTQLEVSGNPLVFPAQVGIPGFLGNKTNITDYQRSDGTVFLPFLGDHFNNPANPFAPANRLVRLANDGLRIPSNLDPQGSFTVTVPAYTDGLALHIAVWKEQDDDSLLAVNYFEFSQEPAHEWVEIVNIAEDPNPIDLSGWVLEVGHPQDETNTRDIINAAGDIEFDNVTFESLRRRFRVPDGTQIAPGGKLLLGFSKFDFLGAPDTLVPNAIDRNGMALANTGFLPDLTGGGPGFVPGLNLPEPTVPPIPMGDPRLVNGFWPMGPPLGGDGSPAGNQPGSVFRRVLFDPDEGFPIAGTLRDFVDDIGDGLDDLQSLGLQVRANRDPAVRPEELGASYNVSSTPYDTLPFPAASGDDTGSGPNKPFDRIVQLEPLDDTVATMPIFGPSVNPITIAKTVLAGGVFPHYPERDARDNSQNAARLRNDRLNNALAFPHLVPEAGADQGAPGFNPPVLATPAPQPGAYSSRPVPYAGSFTPVLQFDGDGQGGLPSPFPELHNVMVGNGTDDFPEFKFFLERRWNPGDRVKVTLYTGRPSEERIADRVTYTERDIVNRDIHDGIATPYQRAIYTDASGFFDPTGDFNRFVSQALDERFPSMWPDDTMGVDFYRSLERKHPMYSGDRFGSTNRWTATDGNYDDWGAGWGKKIADIRVNPVTGAIEGSWGAPSDGLDLRWTGYADDDRRQNILIGHQLEASPLRMNMSARQFENPVAAPTPQSLPTSSVAATPMESQRQFLYTSFPQGSALTQDPYSLQFGPLAPGFSTNNLLRWTWQKPRVRNRALSSAGDLLNMPSVNLRRRLWFGSFVSGFQGTPGGTFSIPTASIEPYGIYRDGVTSVLLGEGNKQDLTGLTAMSLMEPKVLTAGQANTYLLTPGPDSSVEFESLAPFDVVRASDAGIDPVTGLEWPSGTVITSPDSFPRAWTPVLLYSLPGDELFRLAPTVGSAAAPSGATLPPGGTNVLMHTARTPDDVFFFLRNPLFVDGEETSGVGEQRLSGIIARSTPRTRVAFWAASNPPGVDRQLLGVNPDPTTPPPPSVPPAEVLFEWDGDSGLENGDYEVYIVTAEPLDGLAEYADIVLDPTFVPSVLQGASDTEIDIWRSRQRRLAQTLTPTALAILQQARDAVPSALPVDVEILTDRDGNRRVWSDPLYPRPADFRAGGNVDGEAINPESAGLLKRAIPDSQGVIHYGPVRVENNYLALRLRNWAAPGRVNRFSRVVLTPVNRVRGRININTVATVRHTGEGPTMERGPQSSASAAANLPYPTVEESFGLPLFNPLAGLPGVLTASYDEQRPFVDDIRSPLERLRLNVDEFRIREGGLTYPNLLGRPRTIDGSTVYPVVNMYDRALGLSERIMRHRPDWGDGRYYRYPSDLVAWEQSVPWPNADHLPGLAPSDRALLRAKPYGNEYPHYPSEVITSLPPVFAPGFTPPELGGMIEPALNDATLYLIDPARGMHEYKILQAGVVSSQDEQYFLNNARFNENQYRFSRMVNNITTRSDVFEIVVTAQSGYVPTAGERREGINYRNEFVVQGEQKIRVIYER